MNINMKKTRGFSLLSLFITFILIIQSDNLSANHFIKNRLMDYDTVPFSCKTWKRIDINWKNPYHTGHVNHASLLRPNSFIQQNNIAIGNHIRLNAPGFIAPDTPVNITAIHSLYKDSQCIRWKSSGSYQPVIGIYSYQTDKVQKFMVKKDSGHITVIHATPSHPFYVYDLNRYLPVSRITPLMKLINEKGQFISLVCSKGKDHDCGINGPAKKIFTVYNIEVYQKHDYFIGKTCILVHNMCDLPYQAESLKNLAYRAIIKECLTEKIIRVGKIIDRLHVEGVRPDTHEKISAAVRDYHQMKNSLSQFLSNDKEAKALKRTLDLRISAKADGYGMFHRFLSPQWEQKGLQVVFF